MAGDASWAPEGPSGTAGGAGEAPPWRLPRTASPVQYRLWLAPDLEEARFEGTVEIRLEVHEACGELVCNAAELVIDEARVTLGSGEALEAEVLLDPGAERATFRLNREIPPGEAVLRCRFQGVLNEKLRGFYRSTFVDSTGATRTIATTQMEAADARRAFPCWDEPDRKAVFEVTLAVDPALAAFSNAAVVSETVEADGKRHVRFAPTIKMSTYLVAFVVGPLEATAAKDVGGVPVRVVHAPGKEHLAGFALEVAAHALGFFRDYFALAYPGDKMDLVAIPDFAFGAMENLGCITFRETALLVDPEAASRVERERVADVVCHEIAHMWFGDLVTMGWWEGIWLNEAFATFMEVLCVDAWRPEWERWVSFGMEREAALAVDGLHTTRPIEYPVGPPEEAEGMFDVLTYQKGGSVLRMLEQYLGPETFRDGVRAYLRAHAYANTVTGDLWDALEEVSGEPVRAMMDSWILQGGHPALRREGDQVVQEPFAYRPAPDGTRSAIGGPWEVPVLVRALRGGPPGAAPTGAAGAPGGATRLLVGAGGAALDQAGTGGGFALLNAGGWGVYRVLYGAEDLGAVGGHVGELAPLELANLFGDTWAGVLAGRTALTDFLALARSLSGHAEPSAWTVVAGALSLCERVCAEEDRPALAAATRALLGEQARTLGWEPKEGEGERVPALRALLIGMLGTLGADEEVRGRARELFSAAHAPSGGARPVDPDIEGAVLEVVAEGCDTGDYEAMLARYRNPSTPQEEMRYLYALAAFPSAELCRATFELAAEEVRTQNAPYLVASLLANRVGGPVVWSALTGRWEELLARFPDNSHARMVGAVRTLCGTAELAEEVQAFLEAHPLRSGQLSVRQTLERLGVNRAFAEREGPGLGRVLGALSGRGPAASTSP